jgi:hypothetical protein
MPFSVKPPPTAGTGDVVGPAAAVANRIAVFNGVTGKLLADGGQTIADLAALPAATKLDDLTAPDDNTDLNASMTAHGLLKKLSNVSTQYMSGTGVWSAPGASASQWALVATQVAAGAANYDFTGLGSYGEIRVMVVDMVLSLSGETRLRVSINAGVTYLSTSGDYIGIQGVGAKTNFDALAFYSTAATAARSGEILIAGTNLAAQKSARSNFFSTDSIGLRLIPTTSTIDAVRVFATAGNLSTGTIYVFGR